MRRPWWRTGRHRRWTAGRPASALAQRRAARWRRRATAASPASRDQCLDALGPGRRRARGGVGRRPSRGPPDPPRLPRARSPAGRPCCAGPRRRTAGARRRAIRDRRASGSKAAEPPDRESISAENRSKVTTAQVVHRGLTAGRCAPARPGACACALGAVRDLLAAGHPGRGDDGVLAARRGRRGTAGPRRPSSTRRSARPRSRTSRPCRSSRRRPRRPRRRGSGAAARPSPPCRPRPSGGSGRGRGSGARPARSPRAARSRPSSIASTSSSSTCRTRPATSRDVRVVGQQRAVLVAQREQARRLAADDRRARLGAVGERAGQAARLASSRRRAGPWRGSAGRSSRRSRGAPSSRPRSSSSTAALPIAGLGEAGEGVGEERHRARRRRRRSGRRGRRNQRGSVLALEDRQRPLAARCRAARPISRRSEPDPAGQVGQRRGRRRRAG